MSLHEQLGRERDRLARMEAEADRARDRRGHRSPVDLRIIAEQRKTVQMVREALIAAETTGPTDPLTGDGEV